MALPMSWVIQTLLSQDGLHYIDKPMMYNDGIQIHSSPGQMLITRTPYRFSFYGGGLDYPEWHSKNAARVLCAGLDYYCYQTVRILPPFFDHKYRAAYSKVESTSNLDEIEHPAVREIVRAYGKGKPLEISHVGDLPAKSGIGSSSAFSVGLINSLTALNGQFMGRSALANASIKLEQQAMGERVGFQDQCAAAFGGVVLIEADRQGIQPRRFVSRSEYIDYIADNLLMGFDGIERLSSVASSRISESITEEKNKALLLELATVSDLGISAFSGEADIQQHAFLTKEARNIKLHLNGDNHNNRINELIEATERAGSLCTRIMGAGGGGFFVCWAPKHKHTKIMESVNIRTWVNVRFSRNGSQVIFAE